MSKRETPMTRAYWKKIGGTLVEEFCAVRRSKDCGNRLIDGIILPRKERKIISGRDFNEKEIKGEEIIVVQTKATRLGMYVMGQALFSAELMKKFKPKSILSVALVKRDDSILRPIFESYPNMKVVILDQNELSHNTSN